MQVLAGFLALSKFVSIIDAAIIIDVMTLVTLNIDSIPLGQPMPFALRGVTGLLLANKGYVIQNRADLEVLVERGVELCLDTEESGDSHRIYLNYLQRMLLSDKSMGEIAAARIGDSAADPYEGPKKRSANWPNLQLLTTQLLRSPRAGDFGGRLFALYQELSQECQHAPDAALLGLIQISGREAQMYSATHSMLVACVCIVVARTTLNWPEDKVLRLGCAALTMNCAMTELQDQLALQTSPLTMAQITDVENHAERTEALLLELGVEDAVWLEAVRLHHYRSPGPLKDKTEAQQIARLIQRADIFAARLAPRASRTPMPVTAAMQSCYHDEEHKVDEAGAAIVKTLGVYPPGTYVRLVSQETGLVLRRGNTATTPRVAVLINRDGMPTAEMTRRDTAQAQWKISSVVAPRDIRVQVPLERLLARAIAWSK